MTLFGLPQELLSFLEKKKDEVVVLNTSPIELRRVIFRSISELDDSFSFLGFNGVSLIKEDVDDCYDVSGIFVWLPTLKRFASFSADDEVSYIFEDISWLEIESNLCDFINIQWYPTKLKAIALGFKEKGLQANIYMDSEESEESEEVAAYNLEWKLKEKFEKTKIAKSVHALKEEVYRLERLNRFIEVLTIRQNLLEELLEHAEKWMSIFGNCDQYCTDFTYLSADMMKAYVVMQDYSGMDKIIFLARKLHQILGDAKFDLELFEQGFQGYYADISTFQIIYDFIKNNPKYQQRSLYKTLSLEGRKVSYMFEWGDKLKKITRIRHSDTWLLSCTN